MLNRHPAGSHNQWKLGRAGTTSLRNEEGGGSVEYGILLALLAVTLVSLVIRISSPLGDMYERITQCVQNAGRC